MAALAQQIEIFSQRLPKKPYYTDDLATGLRIVAKSTAKKARYIQPNGATHRYYLVFDVDRAGAAIDWADRKVPAPNITVKNPENGHAHLIYCLETSIRTAPDASLKPLKYAAAVERALRHVLDADVNYSGLICKNPLNAHWQVAVWEENSYTLDWLADCLDMNASEARRVDYSYGLGRNCQLFDKTRKWAYRAIRQGYPEYEQWLRAVHQRAEAYNIQFESPLLSAECFTVAKSIAKWTYLRFCEGSFQEYIDRTHTPDIQSQRGKKGGRPKTTTADGNPWEELGISRATYYRRLNKK